MSFLPIFHFWLVHSYLAIEINFVKFVCFISLASVQIYIQVVLLCNCNNNNIRKQVYMAFEQGLFNSTQVSKDKFILQRNQLFNLTRTLTNQNFEIKIVELSFLLKRFFMLNLKKKIFLSKISMLKLCWKIHRL